MRFFTHPSDDEFSCAQLKDNVAEVPGLSDSSSEDLQHEILQTDKIETFRKLATEKSQTDGYFLLLIGYAQSPFRDFVMYLRCLVGLDEDDIQLILKQYISCFVT